MNSTEIREAFLAYFEQQGHLRRPSASLVPPAEDTSVLLTTAGMQPLKPYFRGEEEPPSRRLASCQRCFRTVDIDVVGSTERHLTFFEMLGNFSFGDYFKEGAIALAWELSLQGLGLNPDEIWVTVFAGDPELGLGAATEAVELWKSHGVPHERIVRLPLSENYWQAGPTGPCGPCSELYLDRGLDHGGPDDLPGDDTDRFLEYWNLVFMAYELHEDGSLTDLPQRGIDTGLGLERQAAIQQGVASVFETDLLRPLVELAEELSGRSYDSSPEATRAMRILADHSRGMVNLIADGVVPSNEDRGYVLRRIMRRAIQQGRVLGLEAPYLERFAERAIDLLGEAYPHLEEHRETVIRWVGDEEQSFGRTLDRGSELLAQLVADAKESGTSWVDAADAFRLHDTYGFPYDLTRELVAAEGLEVDDAGFEELMAAQRERARSGAEAPTSAGHEAVLAFAREAPPTSFVGYESLRAQTSVLAARPLEGDNAVLLKLEQSPFYAEGGGQVADSGTVSWDGGEATVDDVYRVGDDQALRVSGNGIEPGAAVEARVDHEARHATMRNHTATHLLHAALRERLGTHARQAGSAVRPDKLRFDFTHGAAVTPEELRDVENRVNEWIKASRPVRALQMDRAEAEAIGAMALFGEKYGDWVRVVEVDEVSRELCAGTHVANTAEVGIFAIVGEGSSAANVRRIEAITGPVAIDWFRQRRDALEETGRLLGSPRDPLAGAKRACERLAELERGAARVGMQEAGEAAESLVAAAEEAGGVQLVVARSDGTPGKALLDLADRVKAKLTEGAVVLGGADGEKVVLVASFTPAVVERGVKAGEVIRQAAALVGGGGGGRDDVAQAGGRDPAKLDEALAAAREAIRRGLTS